MTPARQGDPDKQVRGTEGAAPEAEGDAADDAREQATVARETPGEARTTEAKAEGDDTEQDQPAPKRRARRKAADAKADEAADAQEAGDEGASEDKPKRRRRGAAETTAAAPEPKPAPRRDADGQVIVRASAKYVRTAPRKARLVIDHIRGKTVEDARAILQHTPRAASHDVLKLLNSAVANAENNHELVADELRIHQAYVDEGPTLKRYRPRAMGRATRIRKRTSHMTITLTTKSD